MNIAYSCDGKYFNIFFVSIVSLLEKNIEIEDLNIYLLCKNFTIDKKQKINEIILKYGKKISIIDIENYCNTLRFWQEEEDCRYARLLLGEIIKEEKVIYLDCDTMICQKLDLLWNVDISSYYGGAVLDTARKNARNEAGIDEKEAYYNSGVMIINLERWRGEGVYYNFLNYKKKISKGIYRDQRVINACISKKMRTIHPRYNLMPEMIRFNSMQLKKLSAMENYYSDEELEEARRNPVVIHFAGRSIDRPWYQNCEHPYKQKYIEYIDNNDSLLQFNICRDTKRNCIKWKIRNKLPFVFHYWVNCLKNMK